MKTLFLPSLTKALNAYLKLDGESSQRLKKLQGKAMTIELLPMHWVFHCVFSETGIHLQENEFVTAETTIRGTPLQMLGVMMIKNNRQRFFAEDVIIEGDAELGQQVIALFDDLQIDWEEPLSQLVGDVPAYHVGRFVHGVGEWFRHTETRFTDDVSDYIHEEGQWLPSREALQDFFLDIDTLRMDVDRAEAKFQHLCAQLMENKEAQ